jgi:hypothetical protein
MGTGSQKRDIEDLRDALIGGIGADGSTLAESLAGETVSSVEMDAQETSNQIVASLREIVYHLRIITGETPRDGEV